ncbi:ariadne ring protein [Colletotrichum tofieldiae]|nr:ariadne ring protein [Colletotrichum tofieldiae]GKT74300.1 ariadne ring protein [Colletotrichum tofieldiae]
MMGARVFFGPGAEVTRVSLSTDFTAIRLWDIDDKASIKSIWKGLAATCGYKAHQHQIYIKEGSRGTVRFADLAVDDMHFAQNICRGFQEIDRKHGSRLSDDVRKIPSFVPWLPEPQFAATDSRTLLLTWRKPTKTAMLVFRNGCKARELARLFHDGLMEAFDSHVRAEVISMPCQRTAVQLSGLQTHFSNTDVVKRIPQDLTPNGVFSSPPSVYRAKDRLADLAALAERLQSVGPVAYDLCPQPVTDGHTTSATVRFVDEADARRAVRKYDNTVLPFQRGGVLHVAPIFTAQFTVPYRWLRNPKAPLGRLRAKYPQVDIKVSSHASPDIVSVEVTSKDAKSAVQVRRIFESVFDVYTYHQEEHARLLQDPPSLQDAGDASGSDCPVCMTKPTEPIQSSCGHVYCLDCYAHLSESAADSVTNSAIRCIGNEGSCQKAFALSELRSVLPTADYRHVLEASLTSYVRRNPLELRNCPTPGCLQLYRPTPKEANVNPVARCPDCLVVLCAACHAHHDEGVSCDKAEDDANAELRKALNIKGCPRCETFLERTEGCNHVECEGCHTHICWVCMGHYPESLACYEHMRDTHGGAYAGIPGYDVFGERIREGLRLLPGVAPHLKRQFAENLYGPDEVEGFEAGRGGENNEEEEYDGPDTDVEGYLIHD